MSTTLEELLAQKQQIDAAIEAERARVRDAGMQTIRELIQRLALTKEDLDQLFPNAPAVRAPVAGTAAAGERQAHPNRGVKLPPKYMDPATGNKWSGRGLKPRWITDHEARGLSIDEFLVRSK